MDISLHRLGALILGLEQIKQSIDAKSLEDTLAALKYLFTLICEQEDAKRKRRERSRNKGRRMISVTAANSNVQCYQPPQRKIREISPHAT